MMKIRIEYCVMWNYKPKASRAEAELINAFPKAQIQLAKGGGGVFDVFVDEIVDLVRVEVDFGDAFLIRVVHDGVGGVALGIWI